MVIFYRTLSQSTLHPLCIEKHHTIHDMKEMIFLKHGLPMERQCLVFNGFILKEDWYVRKDAMYMKKPLHFSNNQDDKDDDHEESTFQSNQNHSIASNSIQKNDLNGFNHGCNTVIGYDGIPEGGIIVVVVKKKSHKD